jgi:hypothetical protein
MFNTRRVAKSAVSINTIRELPAIQATPTASCSSASNGYVYNAKGRRLPVGVR